MKFISVLWLVLLFYPVPGFTESQLPFHVYEVKYQTIEQTVTLDAVVEAVNAATVSSQVSGRVIGINFDVDDVVKKGQILVRLANRQQRSRVDEIVAKELEAQAQYNVDLAEFKRIQQLAVKKLVSKSVIDQADAKLRRAKERLNSAAARLKDAETKLRYAVVRAPFSGVVVERHVELGELARIGQVLMSGVSLAKLRIRAYVPQSYITEIRKNKQVQVSFTEGLQLAPISTVKVTVAPQADRDSHSFVVRAELPDNIPGLYPGMFSKLTFATGKARKLLVPNLAIVKRSELSALYVVSEAGAVQLRQVRVGSPYPGEQTEILAGLSVGERIALDPVKATIYLKKK
ncbi:MAG: efflux RND transporter periplasmic adaptor subunit [Thiohalomonadales bacterium]